MSRRTLPVLAEISAPRPGDSRAWSLHREDFEALAGLRERLEDHRVVVVTGTEGLVAGTALAVAGAASAVGRRTALLECDLAAPTVAAGVGLAPTPGLHEYLRWEATAPQILQPLVLAGPAARAAAEPLICVVAGQPAAENALTLLASESFRHATTKLGSAYELTVVVAPSLDRGDGALEIVAECGDAVLACVAAEESSGRALRRLRKSLRRLPAAPLGAIVVSAPPQRS
jgi:Mrp family chromosome partitioning ATPase